MRTMDGVDLATEHHSVPDCRGRVVIVHGYAEHKGRYRQLVEALVEARYACHDAPGFSPAGIPDRASSA